ncbi:IS3 family transposase [Staphylococcus aureus]|uniref:IS3 family transposase n=1 Tax=Staphylococcus aureus TaxID=1280 RepID=UPI001EFCA296|nr:IS3 family transposase [Staphylococcus aureus]
MISPKHKLSVNRQLKILGISKGRYYYKPAPENEEDLRICEMIDKEHLEHPTKGVMQMREYLLTLNILIGPKRVRRLMRKMGIEAVYPKPNLSKLGRAKYVHKYLLRNLKITRRNQVWSTDITYIPMRKGYLYLYAIIDVYSRYIVGWGLYSTLESANAIEVLDRAVAAHGAPEIINSDQGSQYTCHLWIDALKGYHIQISMDGRGRCRDNAWIERFWRTIKEEYVYLNPQNDGMEMRAGIAQYIRYYNNDRAHSSNGHMTPRQAYEKLPSAA